MRTRDGERPVVLLVEDDPGDQELTRRAMQNDATHADLRIASDGEEAMDYLLRRGRYADPASAPRPNVILLDLNMPRMNGRQVLEQLRNIDDLRRIPVIVLTTSKHEEDILRSYDLGCNSYVTKPVELDEFVDTIRRLGLYWLELVTLPKS